MANVIRELVIKVSVDADTSGFNDLNDAQEKTSIKSVALGNIIANATTKLIEMGIAAAKAGAAMISDLVFGTTKAADEIAKTSKQLGIQSEQLQRLAGATTLSGSGTEDLEKGVRTLTKGLADAKLKGTGPAADALATLGLEIADVEQALVEGDIEGLVGVVGDAFNETADSAEKSAALLQLFGKGGAELRPLVEEGSVGISALGDQIKNVISDEDLAQFEDLADAQFLVDDAVQDLKNQIAIGLAPAVEEIANRFGAWIDENRDFIDQDLPAILENVGGALIDLTEFILDTVDSWREFIVDVENLVEIFQTDFPEASGAAGDALSAVGDIADSVGESILDVVNFILDAVSKIEALESTVAGIRAGLGLDDDEVTTQRGGAVFLGGGKKTASAEQLSPERSADSLQRIADDPNFSETDREVARQSASIATQRETLAANADAQAANGQGAEALANKRAAAAERAARREKTAADRAKAARRRGGGGGRSRPAAAAAEPTLDELVSSAVGLGAEGAQAVGREALAGTILVNTDNSVNITNGPVTLSVEIGGLPENATAQDIGSAVRDAVEDVLMDQRRVTFDQFASRLNVGSG